MERYGRVAVVVGLAALVIILGACSEEKRIRKAAEKEMERIYRASQDYIFQYDSPPYTVEEMEEKGYLRIDPWVREQWRFEIRWPKEIAAISTEENPLGQGEIVTLDISNR